MSGPVYQHRNCDEARGSQRATQLFFGDGQAESVWPLAREAVAMCLVCPVWRECLTWASESTDSWKFGIYGGLLPRERRRIAGVPDLNAALALAASRRVEAVVA